MVNRLDWATVWSWTMVDPSSFRNVAVMAAGLAASGFWIRMNWSKNPVAPSANIHLVSGLVTPLALCPPAFEPSRKYIERSTTMSRLFVHSTTADTAVSSSPGMSLTRTDRRLVGAIVNCRTTALKLGRRNVTVISAAVVFGLPTRISSSKKLPVAPSARYHFS